MGLYIVYFKGSQVEFSKYDVFLPLKVALDLANGADPDEVQHYGSSLFAKSNHYGVSSIKGLLHDVLTLYICNP